MLEIIKKQMELCLEGDLKEYLELEDQADKTKKETNQKIWLEDVNLIERINKNLLEKQKLDAQIKKDEEDNKLKEKIEKEKIGIESRKIEFQAIKMNLDNKNRDQEFLFKKEIETRKLELEEKRLNIDLEKEKMKFEIELKKIENEKAKLNIETMSKEMQKNKDFKNKIFDVSVRLLELAVPATLSLLMWYGQNRLIYIDDGRATPELKDIIRSVNKKIF